MLFDSSIRKELARSFGATLVVLGMLYFAIRITSGLLKAPAGGSPRDSTANAAG